LRPEINRVKIVSRKAMEFREAKNPLKVEMKPLNDIATELTKVGRRSVVPDGFDADVLHKKFITDKDVLSIIDAGVGEIRIAKTSIITDIAMERIKKHGLNLLRL